MRHKVALRQGVAMVRFDVLGDRRVSVNRGNLIATIPLRHHQRDGLLAARGLPPPAPPAPSVAVRFRKIMG